MNVFFGHPEDAVAVAFAVYAFVFALNGRFADAGWLFGVALMFQPLVLLMCPCSWPWLVADTRSA